MKDKEVSEIEVYENQIDYYSREYIDTLEDSKDIYTSSVFTGMIKYIYNRVFKPNRNNNDNKRSISIVNYDDIELLDNLFNIYTSLCYRYKKKPTVLNFCIMVGISNTTVNDWHHRRTRNSNPAIYQTVQKWFSECESALLDGAIESNSIGCIFALKANYGYSDNSPQRLIIDNGSGSLSAEQIAEKYKETALPEKPNMD